jgi:hypothetical protein
MRGPKATGYNPNAFISNCNKFNFKIQLVKCLKKKLNYFLNYDWDHQFFLDFIICLASAFLRQASNSLEFDVGQFKSSARRRVYSPTLCCIAQRQPVAPDWAIARWNNPKNKIKKKLQIFPINN